MVADLVERIGGDRIVSITLIEGGIDPHSYELVKGDDEKITYAQLVFHNGLGLEHGASLNHSLANHPRAFGLGDLLRKNDPSLIIMHEGEVDPHIWLDVSIWAQTARIIVKELSNIDPEGAPLYDANGIDLQNELIALDARINDAIKRFPPEKRYLVTAHEAFHYFARRYLNVTKEESEDRFRAPEGIAPDGQISCRDIQLIVNYIIQHEIRKIFPEADVGRDSLNKVISVCKEKGVPLSLSQEVLYSDTLGVPGSSLDSYQKIMEHNAAVICNGLSE